MGAGSVSFGLDNVKTTKWTEQEVLQRFREIIEPGPSMVGMPIHPGPEGEQMAPVHQRDFVDRVRAGLPYARLQSVYPPAAHRYTVSLRNIARSPKRNSDRSVWLPFAEQIGAHVIEDGSISVHERMALYAGAEMNFGVTHGAMHLCSLSSYPMAMFECGKAEKMFVQNGITPGTNYPWSLPNQHLVWNNVTVDGLMRWFDAHVSKR